MDYNLAPLLSSEEANVAYLPRDKLLDRLLDSCQPHYKISNERETQIRYHDPHTHLIENRKGKAPKIHIFLEKRQGRKTVTRIWGLESFFLDPHELADELRNICATSASVGGQCSLNFSRADRQPCKLRRPNNLLWKFSYKGRKQMPPLRRWKSGELRSPA